MTEAHKRALIVAYFLSRFDRKGVKALGYGSSTEAFAAMAKMIGVKPATVKHMRDSFDPYCSQVRVGWYQRKILPSRANVIQAYDGMGADAMEEIVRELLGGDEKLVGLYTAPVDGVDEAKDALLSEDNPFANRLRTGEEAETFFIGRFPHLPLFAGSVLDDTRKLGIGFDFRAALSGSYHAVEVKGVRGPSGYISFTDKEWSVAGILGESYVLALVRALDHDPVLELIPNPTLHLSAKMQAVESVSISWNAKV